MPNFGWPELLIVAGVLAALRAVLLLTGRGTVAPSIFAGFVLVAAGLWYYVEVSPQWSQAQSFLGRVAGALDPRLRAQTEQIRSMYYGSLVAMIGGGVLILAGLVRQISFGSNRAP